MKKKKYRRGFKTEANEYAREFREELNFKPHEPLCPWKLAKYLEIPVQSLSTYKSKIPEAVSHYTGKDSDGFSAVTICDRYRRQIIHNDSHHFYRQAANISHELSHGILGHMPMPVLDEYGCRYFNEEQEDEANWLGPALLISQEAAIYIVKTGMELDEASKIYGASKKVITMRINVTGARKIVSRSSSY
jgi:Zn-dependent peptidase ImmA (M78 family)